MNALHATAYPVARVVAARDGAMVVDVDGRRCVLFEWVPGRPLRDDPRPSSCAWPARSRRGSTNRARDISRPSRPARS